MWRSFFTALCLAAATTSMQLPTTTELSTATALADLETTPWPRHVTPLDAVAVTCLPDAMHVTVTLAAGSPDEFNGIVYPAGLGSNSSCLREYVRARRSLEYSVPLQGCNTMAADKEDGTIEYFNNIIVQGHLRLVTGQGRGYQVRCRYRARDLARFQLSNAIRPHRLTNALPDNYLDSGDEDAEEYDEDSGLLPSVAMKIYQGDPQEKQVASNVRIGDTLTLVITLEKNKQYGLLVSECSVKDGLGWAEQSLIADDGCPLDGEIMGLFQYSTDRQQASVSFPAHKFPYTASVYYTCEVKLCDLRHPTDCEACTQHRRRRQADETPAKVEVFTGLYVNEADSQDGDDVTSEKKEDEICISQRNFAIGICVAGVILMVCVIAAIAIILARRRSPKTYSRTGSSLYSGPYTNTGYSHTS